MTRKYEEILDAEEAEEDRDPIGPARGCLTALALAVLGYIVVSILIRILQGGG